MRHCCSAVIKTTLYSTMKGRDGWSHRRIAAVKEGRITGIESNGVIRRTEPTGMGKDVG